MEEYEVSFDVMVPIRKKKITAVDENDAIEQIKQEYAKKGITEDDRFENFRLDWVPKKAPVKTHEV